MADVTVIHQDEAEIDSVLNEIKERFNSDKRGFKALYVNALTEWMEYNFPKNDEIAA